MRHIDWSSRLTDDDVTWLRASGLRLGPNNEPIERAIENNQGSAFKASEDVNDPSRSALDPTGTGAQPFASLTADEQRAALNAGNPAEVDDDADDYDEWTKDELKSEVDKRKLEVTGTGRNGSVLVVDLVGALRQDDKNSADV